MDSVVRLVPSGLRFDARRASLLHVDDAAGLLLVVAGSEVAAYSLAAPGAPPRVTRIEEGAPVRRFCCPPCTACCVVARSSAESCVNQRHESSHTSWCLWLRRALLRLHPALAPAE